MRTTTLIILTTFLITSCEKMVDIDQTQTLPTTPYSSINANKKSRILNYLEHLSTIDTTIIGQQLGDIGSPYYTDNSNIDFLTKEYGKTPGLMGLDLGYDDCSRNYTPYIDYIKQFTDSGGLVTLNFSPPNPRSSKGSHDLTAFEYSDLIKEGTLENIHFKAILNNVGNVLQKLKDENIIVIWRPFHEMNGGWFWWGKNDHWASPNEFKNMWVYIYNYYYIERKLDNLIWVYCANYQYNHGLKDVLYYYPAPEYVDVVGLNYYHDNLDDLNLNSSFDKLKSLNKPIAITEIGPNSLRDGSFDNKTYEGLLPKKIAYFMAWSNWPSNKLALKDCQNVQILLNNSLILTRDKINY